MKINIKEFFRSFIPSFLLYKIKRLLNEKYFEQWKRNGCVGPPPRILKQLIIGEYQQKSSYTTFIETGTYRGDMVEAQKSRFKKIISIELSKVLYKKAKYRFSGEAHINLIYGDSGKMLPKILDEINEPAIFWLDAHYFGGITEKGDKECPIIEELEAIFNSKPLNHLILIDDADFFNGKGDYPTIDKLIEFIMSKNKTYQVEVKHDIIRCFINSKNLVQWNPDIEISVKNYALSRKLPDLYML
jgi:hypothetical protein